MATTTKVVTLDEVISGLGEMLARTDRRFKKGDGLILSAALKLLMHFVEESGDFVAANPPRAPRKPS